MKRKSEKSLRGFFHWYSGYPLVSGIVLLVAECGLILIRKSMALNLLALTAVYFLGVLLVFWHNRTRLNEELIKYAINYDKTQKQQLREMILPYAMLGMDGRLIWGNDAFLELVSNRKLARRSITNVLPDISIDDFPVDEMDTEKEFVINETYYRAVLRLVSPEGFRTEKIQQDGEVISRINTKNCFVCIYLYDITEIKECQQKLYDEHVIMGFLYIDNYEEAMDSVDAVKRSLLVGLVDRKINKYMQEIDAIVNKLEKDRYFFIFPQKNLEPLKEKRFNLLEEVRGVNIGNEMAMTISMGIGVNEEGYQKSYEYARAAIDLALGRGGDQVVLKENEKISYYGGKSVQVEKNTRVKARVKAHALRELVLAKDRVVVMGHNIGDVDCFGAAVGIYRIAKTLGKRAYIVMEEQTKSVKNISCAFENNPDYEENMVVTHDEARDLVDNNTLLVIVDVNRPGYTEYPELLKRTRTIVVLDHHRQTDEKIENAVLSYIEPFASSACEMVAEVMQYTSDNIKLKGIEADALYAGIVIDTNNFQTKSGSRTFEAAAYLRKCGADITRIRKAFRNDLDEYRIRAKSIQHTEIFRECYAITECRAQGAANPTVLGAQVANELLNIENVKASFVLTEYNDKIYVSARSIDEVNVQVIMERIGGGGHMSVAGAQLKDMTVEEGKNVIRDLLATMQAEGDL